MDQIVIFEGAALAALLDEMQSALEYSQKGRIFRARIAIDHGTFKVKWNEGIWSPPMGELERSGE